MSAMKKSISTWSFPGDWDLRRQLEVASAAGFAGFEVALAEDGPVSLTSTGRELVAVRRLADKEGLVLSGLASGLYWGANPASGSATVRRRAAEIVRRQIETAATLGIDAILVVPGAVGVDFIPGCEIVPYETAYERATDFVRAALPLAEKRRVTLAVENVWNKFLLSPLEMRAFLAQFDSERVASYFDVGNALAFGYPEQWIDILGARIARVHFKDYRRAVGTADGFCDLLSGDVDWPAVMRALHAARYAGWIAAEMIPPVPFYKHAPEVLIQNTSRAMDAIFKLR
jgi:L-ribulose-5-phosphate 3-epimerase